MRAAVIAALASLLVAAGCRPSDEHFTGAILNIDGDILGRYWVVTQIESVFNVPVAPRDDCGDGFVILRYVIDSHGHVFEAEIVRAEPQGCYEDAAMRLVQTWTFLPTSFNRGRAPVRVTQRIPFTTD